jgi:hypothetical protein
MGASLWRALSSAEKEEARSILLTWVCDLAQTHGFGGATVVSALDFFPPSKDTISSVPSGSLPAEGAAFGPGLDIEMRTKPQSSLAWQYFAMVALWLVAMASACTYSDLTGLF